MRIIPPTAHSNFRSIVTQKIGPLEKKVTKAYAFLIVIARVQDCVKLAVKRFCILS